MFRHVPFATLAALTTLAALFGLVTPSSTLAQEMDDPDPLKGTHKLGESSEILLLWSNDDGSRTRFQTVYDYLNLNNPDPNVPNQLPAHETQSISASGGTEDETALDVISGDFDGDGLDDYVAVWEGPDRSIEVIIPDMDRENLKWTSPNLTTVAGAGSMLNDTNGPRVLRLARGDFDQDRASEFLLAYWGADATLQIELYETDAGRAPTRLTSFNDPEIMFTHLNPAAPPMVERSTRWFDVNAGDFDGDGTDEVIVVAGREIVCPNGQGCWSVVARVYDVHPETFQLVLRAEETLFTKEDNSSQFMNRIAVEPGRYGSEFDEGAAIVFQQTTNESDTRWYLTMTRVMLAKEEDGGPLNPALWGTAADTSTFVFGPDGTSQIHQTMGQRGFALSAQAIDFQNDGIEELVLFYRQLEIREIAEDYTPRTVNSGLASSEPGDFGRHSLAVADLDADNDLANESSDWLPEMVVVENDDISDNGGISVDGILNIKVIGWDPALGFNSRVLGEISDHRIDQSGGRPVALAAIDVTDNSVRIGTPKRSAKTGIVRPLIILNAPPTHFDVLDGVAFDVNKCYGATDCACHAARARCFQSEYSTETVSSITTETELTSDWSIATTVEGGFEIPKIEVGVNVSITGRYGQGFRRTNRSTETFTVSQTIQATRDDWIYAMIVNYDIWEYPLYSDGEAVGHIAVVVPKLNTRAWFDSKSWNAFDYIPFHEVGNVLSYRSISDPQENAFHDETVRWSTGDQITLSGSSDTVWRLTKEGETETVTENSVNMGINGKVDFNIPFSFIPNVSVEGNYESDSVHTYTTRVTDTQGLAVNFGNVDQSFGNTRYSVIPYVYWAVNGAIVLDYAVNPELAQPGFEETWWQTQYGELPDPAFILPWRYDDEKGQVVTAAQAQQTREILFDPPEPEVGDVVTVHARVHNWSLLPTLGPVEVRFFVGDPAAGGVPIVGVNGETSVFAAQMTDRGSAVVEMDWQVPSDIGLQPRIYAIVDPLGTVDEIHESNNKGWTVLNVASFSTGSEPEVRDELPATAQLFQNYPNPFHASTTIGFNVVQSGRVTLQILDLLGREVVRIVDQEMIAGSYNVRFDARGLSSGVYLYRFASGHTVQTNAMMHVK